MERIFTEFQAINTRLQTQNMEINKRFQDIEQRLSNLEGCVEMERKITNRRIISLDQKLDKGRGTLMKIIGLSNHEVQNAPQPCLFREVVDGDVVFNRNVSLSGMLIEWALLSSNHLS